MERKEKDFKLCVECGGFGGSRIRCGCGRCTVTYFSETCRDMKNGLRTSNTCLGGVWIPFPHKMMSVGKKCGMGVVLEKRDRDREVTVFSMVWERK